MSLNPGYGSSGYGSLRPRRRGRGRRIAFIVGLVVVVLLAAGVTAFVLKKQSDERARTNAARSAAAAYLAAWTAVDAASPAAAPAATSPSASPSTSPARAGATTAATPAAVAAQGRLTSALVTDTATVPAIVTAITTSRDKLQLTAATYTAGTLSRHGSTATVPYHASLTLAGLSGAFTYDGTLTLRRAGGVWRVAARPDAVYPTLAAGQHLGRTTSTAARGKIVDRTGNQLSDDTELAGNLVGAATPTPTGLQRVYNARLTPSGGAVVIAGPAGQVVRQLRAYPMADGQDVSTTLDLNVQRAGEAALAPLTQNGALVAIDTTTGGVLAIVNHPLNGYGRAVRGTYAPGSTFKIITATAALMSGQTANTPLDCSDKVSVGGRTFQNAESEKFGKISLSEAFAKSCNTAFINLERSLPAGALTRAARLYGFDAAGTGPLPITSFGGSFPAPGDAVAAAASAIGQAQVEASPVQMASVAAAVASGTWRQPFVTGTAASSHPLPAGVAPTLRGFMREVVTTGTAAAVKFPGVVYGKTGTAEYGTDNPPKTNAWFVGYRGTVAFAVIVEDGGFGADTAAPAAARFLTALGS